MGITVIFWLVPCSMLVISFDYICVPENSSNGYIAIEFMYMVIMIFMVSLPSSSGVMRTDILTQFVWSVILSKCQYSFT